MTRHFFNVRQVRISVVIRFQRDQTYFFRSTLTKITTLTTLNVNHNKRLTTLTTITKITKTHLFHPGHPRVRVRNGGA